MEKFIYLLSLLSSMDVDKSLVNIIGLAYLGAFSLGLTGCNRKIPVGRISGIPETNYVRVHYTIKDALNDLKNNNIDKAYANKYQINDTALKKRIISEYKKKYSLK